MSVCEREEKSCSLGERAGGGTEKEKVEATPSNHRDVCEIQEPVARKEEEQNGGGASCTVHTLLASRFVLPPRDFNIPVSSSPRRKKDHHNSVRRWPKRERNNNSFVPSPVVTVNLFLCLASLPTPVPFLGPFLVVPGTLETGSSLFVLLIMQVIVFAETRELREYWYWFK